MAASWWGGFGRGVKIQAMTTDSVVLKLQRKGAQPERSFGILDTSNASQPRAVEHRPDFFIEREGECFAGTHLIIDLYDASRLGDIDHIEAALRDCVSAANATLLHIHLHHFTPNGGVSGVAVLAESHISIHTWPERSYAALDVFMCGAARPAATIEVLSDAFSPGRIAVTEHLRGKVT